MVTLLGVGAAFWIDAAEEAPPALAQANAPTAAFAYLHAVARTRAERGGDRAAGARSQRTARAEIESALMAKDAQRREAVFTFLLPELVQVDPPRVIAMVARQPPGEARDTLRTEVTRQWMARDPEAAVRWMKSLPEGDRRASAATAVESIVGHSPAEAAALADEFGIASSRLTGPKPSAIDSPLERHVSIAPSFSRGVEVHAESPLGLPRSSSCWVPSPARRRPTPSPRNPASSRSRASTSCSTASLTTSRARISGTACTWVRRARPAIARGSSRSWTSSPRRASRICACWPSPSPAR